MTTDTMIAQVQGTVREVLTSRFPDNIDFGDGTFAIPHGSSSVSIVVRPYTETDCIVELTAQIVSEATMSPELTHWLLRKNAELHFGSFGLLFDDTIIFTYTLPGSVVTSAALEAAIGSVAVIADHYDDEVIKMAGGKRVADI
jgi:hypothetical protein